MSYDSWKTTPPDLPDDEPRPCCERDELYVEIATLKADKERLQAERDALARDRDVLSRALAKYLAETLIVRAIGAQVKQ